MSLQQLVYVSVANVSTRAVSDLYDILKQSVRNNAIHGVTGALAFTDTHFVQLLEGSGTSLDNLLANLPRDPRHRDLAIVERMGITARTFADWSMLTPKFTACGQTHLEQLILRNTRTNDEYRGLFEQMVREQAARFDGRRAGG